MQTTSAIGEMTVPEVRKCLAHMRRKWAGHSCIQPFMPSGPIVVDSMKISMSEFSFRFIMGHHSKRHTRATLEIVESAG